MSWEWQSTDHGWDNQIRPNPREEGLHRKDHMKCAFESLEKLYAWFYCDEELRSLFSIGYHIVRLEVPDWACEIGKCQVVYEFNEVTDTEVLYEQENNQAH